MYNTNKILKVAAYCRVSTEHENQTGSLNSQIKYFSDEICGDVNKKLVEVYYDEETGTSVKNRKGFNRMISDAFDGKIDWILTKEVSRFARNTLDTISYVRQLVAKNVGITFTNSGLCTSQPNYEYLLTLLAGQAQEESRLISERVKWGIYRHMESGVVFGKNKILGFRINEGVISIFSEEVETVKRIYHAYLYDKKGFYTIAKELNADGILTPYGKLWADNHIKTILTNEKYVGDLTQRKNYIKHYLTKERVVNDGTEIPFIQQTDHHDGIIDRDVWDAVQARITERRELIREKRQPSVTNWYSSKAVCGKCGKSYNASSNKSKENRTLSCSNRTRHGTIKRKDEKGNEIGCTASGINEKVLASSMEYILQHIQAKREDIVSELLDDIQAMQTEDKPADTTRLETEIDEFTRKKRKIIDLMTDDLITKSDFQEQKAYYNEEIARLTEEVSLNRNLSALHQQQIEKIKAHIAEVNRTADMSVENSEMYGDMLDRFIINEDSITVYLKCLPFGFAVSHRVERYAKIKKFDVFVESLEIVA
jgi:DNA invertase Pin-like site-specific DNA recombinase